MLYAVKIYEQIYEGLYGIQMVDIIEADTAEEVEGICQEMSVDLQQSYSDLILDNMGIYEEAREATDNEDDYEQYLEDWLNENAAYDIYPIISTKNYSLEELEDMLYRDFDGFVKNYCGRLEWT